MTTDNFTEALHDAGDGRYTTPGLRGVFAEGAYWARAHLAAQEPTDAERAVRELHAPRVEVVHGGAGSARTFTVCAECWRVTDTPEGALYPCATIQALDAARAARRDEEKR